MGGRAAMKQLVQLFVTVFVIAIGLMYFTTYLNWSQGYSGANTLTIYNWGDYIDPELITEFEEETGLKVIYQTFDSNEAMMTKVNQGGTTFDISIPSEYAISKMKDEGLLLPIDHTLIPNLPNIDARFMDLSFDPGNAYSIPYFWGTVGIIYNTELLEGRTFKSWNDLWSPDLRNQILLVDGAREVIGFGLNSLQYSLNDTNEEHLQAAKNKLGTLYPNIKAIVGDEIKMLLAGEEAAVGVVWSGDAAEIMDENDKLDYVIPEEGSNLWFDNMVIPKTARNVKGAHQFINFMLDPEHAAQNAEYVGYSTPNAKAFELLPEEISQDERFYPSSELTNKLEVYDNLGKKMLSHYNELFLEFKMHKK
jgi:spermidine/putrescine transport system substrate-binding protein